QLLKRYVAYAKAHCHPTLTLKAARVLQKLYLTMRNEAKDGRSMPITMRQLESLVRLSQVILTEWEVRHPFPICFVLPNFSAVPSRPTERAAFSELNFVREQARAKVELREHVTEQDAKDVVDIMQE
ncbi:unnamed protein product, partial [Scytosiphon promiscuus]